MFDIDPATCINTTEMSPTNGLYMIWMNFTGPENHGFINVRVIWESDINCGMRKVYLV